MNNDAHQHLAAIIRARAQQQYGAWAPHVPYTYGLPLPNTPVAPLPDIGLQLVQTHDGAVSEAPGQQIGAAQPYAFLNNAPRTEFAATDPMAHSVRGGGGTNQVGTPDVPETDPMKIALIPPIDITPEAAVVAYPKPIHTQSLPLNRYPQGAHKSRCRGLIEMLKYLNPNTVLYCTDMHANTTRRCTYKKVMTTVYKQSDATSR